MFCCFGRIRSLFSLSVIKQCCIPPAVGTDWSPWCLLGSAPMPHISYTLLYWALPKTERDLEFGEVRILPCVCSGTFCARQKVTQRVKCSILSIFASLWQVKLYLYFCHDRYACDVVLTHFWSVRVTDNSLVKLPLWWYTQNENAKYLHSSSSLMAK